MKLLTLLTAIPATLAVALPGALSTRDTGVESAVPAGYVMLDDFSRQQLLLKSTCSKIMSPAYMYNVNPGYKCKFFADTCFPQDQITGITGEFIGYLTPHASWYHCTKAGANEAREVARSAENDGVEVAGGIVDESNHNQRLTVNDRCTYLDSRIVSYTVNEHYTCTFFPSGCNNSHEWVKAVGQKDGVLRYHAHWYKCRKTV